MFTVSKSKFLARLDVLPDSIRDAAFSLEIGMVLKSIAETHHLDPARTNALTRIVGAVFFGFVHRTDFAKELGEDLKLDPKIASSIADEVERKVFSRISKELDEFYQPATATEEPREDISEGPSAQLPSPEDAFFLKIKNRISATATVPIPPKKEGALPNAPFVLHEEKSVAEGLKKDSMKGFSLPFGLFKQKQEESSPAARATVEVPKREVEEKKVVHYSEYRTSLTPGAGGEFINLETFGKTSAAPKVTPSAPPLPDAPLPIKAPIVTPSTAAIPAPEATLQIKKIQAAPLPARTQPIAMREGNSPKVEGNTVDLR